MFRPCRTSSAGRSPGNQWSLGWIRGLANNGPVNCGGETLGPRRHVRHHDRRHGSRARARRGRAEITVVLHTNALSWAADGDFGSGPLLFGHRLCDVLQRRRRPRQFAIAGVLSNPAPGAPLPDLMELFVERLATSCRSPSDRKPTERCGQRRSARWKGLHSYAGHGNRHAHPVGLLQGATGDRFPGEHINLRATGN